MPIVVEPGWEAQLTALDRLLLLERRVARVVTYAAGTQVIRCCSKCSTTRSGEYRRANGLAAAKHRLLGQHHAGWTSAARRSIPLAT
jgi:hypothetical protein